MSRFSQEDVDAMMSGSIPDGWIPDNMVTYHDLELIISSIIKQGMIVGSTLPHIFNILKPFHDTSRVPSVGIINRQIKNKQSKDRTVNWLENETPQELKFVGIHCQKIGINKDVLTGKKTLSEPITITNGMVLEIFQEMKKQNATWNYFINMIQHLGIDTSNFTEGNIAYRVRTVFKRKSDLSRRNKDIEKEAFLEEIFIFPQKLSNVSGVTDVDENSHNSDIDTPQFAVENDPKPEDIPNIYQDLYEENLEALKRMCMTWDDVMKDMSEDTKELFSLKKMYSKMEEQTKKLQNELCQVKQEMARWKPRNANKRIQRREGKINNLNRDCEKKQQQVNELKEHIEDISKQKVSLEEKLQHDKQNNAKEKLVLTKSLTYYKQKSEKLKLKLKEPNIQLEQLKCDSRKKDHTIEDLLEEVNNFLEDKLKVSTKVDGKFTDDVRTTVMSLHSLGLGMRNISKCIEVVSKNIFHVNMEILPKKTTIQEILIEANMLGKIQVCKKMLEDKNSTLHFDGTSDHQRHFLGFQVTDQNKKSMVVSMTETLRGDTQTHSDCLKRICQEYVSLLSKSSDEQKELEVQFMMSIKNFMSDQHIVNKKFKEEFEQLRDTMLDQLGDKWENLGLGERQTAVKINHFFCFLHVLLGLADAVDNSLKEYEAIISLDGQLKIGRQNQTNLHFNSEHSKCFEFIRSTCQLLTPGGHAAAGIPEDFKAYLASKDKTSMFKKFEHNRFNIVFENAAALCYHLSDITDFLEISTSNNCLRKCVEADICDDVLISEVKAVGAFYHFFTEPFHRLILSGSIAPNIMEMKEFLDTMVEHLQKWTRDSSILQEDFQMWKQIGNRAMDGSIFFQNSSELKEIWMEVYSLLSTHALVTFSRQIGNQTALMSTDLPETETASVLKSNSISESVFGTLKRLRQIKPNSNEESLETTILWTYNKTITWLDSLSSQDKEQLMVLARTKSTAFQKIFKDRRTLLKKQRLELLQEKLHKKDRLQVKNALKRDNIATEISSQGGHCKNNDDVDIMVESATDAKQLTTLLKNQLKYYKEVIKPVGVPRLLYQASKNRRQFTNLELQEHLNEVITIYNNSVRNLNEQPVLQYPSKTSRIPKIIEAKKRILSNYSIEDHSKPKKKKSATAPNFVDRQIRHRWKVPGQKKHKWYEAKVIGPSPPGTDPSFPEDDDNDLVQYQLYDVIYQGEEDIYHLSLEKDWHNGDIEMMEVL